MESVEQFFINNMGYVFLVYGLAFIVMGVSMSIQPKSESNFSLTRNIWLMATFALLHGINEWLDMMSLMHPSHKVLKTLSFVFLVSSFCFLVEFGRKSLVTCHGVSLNKYFRYFKWWLMPMILSGTLFLAYNSGEWLNSGQILSRYLLAVPGTLLTGAALVFYRNEVGIESKKCGTYFTIAAISFMSYYFFAGLVVPKGSIFPSNIINTESFLSHVHIPVQVFRTICAVIIAITMGGITKIISQSPHSSDNIDEFVRRDNMYNSKNINSHLNYSRFTVYLLITTIILLVISTIWTKYATMNKLHVYAIERLRTYESYLSDKINNYHIFPKLLSERPYIMEYVSNPDNVNNINDKENDINKYLLKYNEAIGASVTYIINKYGVAIASSNYNTPTSFVGKNYSFREYFQNAIKGTPDDYIAIGIMTNKPGYFISYPIRNGKDIVGIVAIKFDLKLFTPRSIDKNEIFVVTDDNGVIFHSSDERYIYHTMDQLPENIVQKIKDNNQYANKPLLPLPIVKKTEKNGIAIITMTNPDKSKSKYEHTIEEYIEVGKQDKDRDWNVFLFVDSYDVTKNIITSALLVLLSMLVVYLIGIFAIYKTKSKNTLLDSYKKLAEQKEKVEARVKEQEIVKSILTISLSSDPLELQLNKMLDNVLSNQCIFLESKGCIFLSDEDTGELKIEASHNFNKDELITCSKIPYGKCHCGMAASTRDIVFTQQRSDEEILSAVCSNMTPQGHYCVPIIATDRLLGVFNLHTGEGYSKKSEHEILLKSIAHTIAAVIIRNETEMKLKAHLEQKVKDEIEKGKQKEQMLVQQSKLATMGEMIGMIAHQWRQPLNAISLTVEDLRDAFDYGDLDKEYMNTSAFAVLRQVQFMAKTIDDFKNFLTPSKTKVDFNVQNAIEDLINMIGFLYTKKNIEIITDITPDSMLISTGYPGEFKQVILNLLNNSRDAIVSRSKSIDDFKGTIYISISEGEDVYVVIRDNGGGIPAEIIDKIYDPYFTTKSSKEGTGLGLYMSKTIIEKNMGGKLSVRIVDDGTEFTITMKKGAYTEIDY
ncbi:MAG: GAF domain-containing protein [Nitrospirae bacterium]|nr:GAF domain-containing protein [Nitrospirota bacterium]